MIRIKSKVVVEMMTVFDPPASCVLVARAWSAKPARQLRAAERREGAFGARDIQTHLTCGTPYLRLTQHAGDDVAKLCIGRRLCGDGAVTSTVSTMWRCCAKAVELSKREDTTNAVTVA